MANDVSNVRKLEDYSDISDKVLSEQSITKSIANKEQLTAEATTLKIYVRDKTGKVRTYTPNTGITPQGDNGAFVTVTNLKEPAVNELLDGVSMRIAPADTATKAFVEATELLAEEMDIDFFIRLVAEGTEVVAAGGAKPIVTTIYQDILDLKLALDNAKAPKRGRSLLVTPEMENLLLNVDSKVILAEPASKMQQVEGSIGRLLGFDVFSTANLPSGTNIIAMQERGGVHADVWRGDVKIVSLDGSANFIDSQAVKGRMAYVQGVIRPELIQINNGQA